MSGQVSAPADKGRRHVFMDGENLAGISDLGLVRPDNQDAFFLDACHNLIAVADGLGAHDGGGIASALAVRAVCSSVLVNARTTDPVQLLHRCFAEADTAITRQARRMPDCKDMGTTLIVALVRKQELFVAHVGDVRAYHLRGRTLSLLTFDHTRVGDLLRSGKIDDTQTRCHVERNQLNKVVGGGKKPTLPEINRFRLDAGDRLLFCSDGLWEELQDSAIGSVLATNADALRIAETLVNEAIAAGGQDNITVAVYQH